MDGVALARELWPIGAGIAGGFAGAVGGLVAWLKWRQDVRKFREDAARDRRREKQELITIAQAAAADTIKWLREEVAGLRKELHALEAELTQLRKEHSDTIAAKDAELALIRGELRQREAVIAALERFIVANGLEPPAHNTQAFFLVPPGADPTDIEPMGGK